MDDEPEATEEHARFRIVAEVGPVPTTPRMLRAIARIFVAVTQAVAPWRRAGDPPIEVRVESDVPDPE